MRWSSIASALAGAALILAGAVGCSHCDTCDDFPTPCVGGDCGYGTSNPMMGPGMGMPPGGPVTMAPGGPALAPADAPAAPAAPAAKPPATRPLPESPPAAPSLPGGSPFEP